ncbi:MAG TPA: hypothetical protein VK589_07560 [Chryseolinea sp.]|nr:hypothetical protein [Chryseolinea sp.]
MNKCNSGKRIFQTQEDAVEALVAARTRFDYREGNGPVSVYRCDECGFFHLTSKGQMNETLKKSLSDGSINRKKQADDWEERLKRK